LNKIGRKIYHLTGGLVLVGLYAALGRDTGLRVLLGVFLFATALDLARLKFPPFNRFMFRHFSKFIRESEKGKLTGTPWYVLGILCAAAFFGLPVALYSVAFLAVGDVAATTVGERWGTFKVSGEKSLQGTLAFFASSAAAGFLIGHFFYPMSAAVILTGAAVAALVEILSTEINDNLTIPVIAGGVMQALLRFGM
jgi:diacylglycerol kinase (CTP)